MSHSKPNNSDENQRVTLDTYEQGVTTYVHNTSEDVTGHLQEYLDYILSIIPQSAQVLEIGSANGRDADYLEANGMNITRSDAVRGFVAYIKSTGKDALVYNVLTDELDQKYDAIIATAVLLHFTEEQLLLALKNMHHHLLPSGTVVTAVKQGTGEEYSLHKMGQERYFRYWQPASFASVAKQAGFKVSEQSERENGKWLVFVLEK